MEWLAIIVAVCMYGVWGYAMKMAVNSMSPGSAQLSMTIVNALVAPVLFLLLKTFGKKYPIVFNLKGISWAAITVVCAVIASFMTLLALEKTSKPGVVNAIIHSCPIVTYVLTVLFLGEALTLQSLAGIVIIVLGILVLGA
jgi:drug/metabolite transporter (DMT)-like permease